jgi:hypothetical protein
MLPILTETDGEWRLTEHPSRVACSFTIQAVKEERLPGG